MKGIWKPKMLRSARTGTTRKVWVIVVWLLTWWIPSFVLRYIGRMKRKDVQMAWREKVTICFFIFLLCGTVMFYIIFFQKLICPEFDKVRTTIENANVRFGIRRKSVSIKVIMTFTSVSVEEFTISQLSGVFSIRIQQFTHQVPICNNSRVKISQNTFRTH